MGILPEFFALVQLFLRQLDIASAEIQSNRPKVASHKTSTPSAVATMNTKHSLVILVLLLINYPSYGNNNRHYKQEKYQCSLPGCNLRCVNQNNQWQQLGSKLKSIVVDHRANGTTIFTLQLNHFKKETLFIGAGQLACKISGTK